MLNLRGKDLVDLHYQIMEMMLWYPKKCVQIARCPTVFSYDNMFTTDSCEFNFDLAGVGFTKNRWTRFLTQYVVREELEQWFQSIKEQRGRVVNLFASSGTSDNIPDINRPEIRGHRWGPCFLGISFRKTPNPQLTLYSRSARMPTVASLELALVSLMAKEIQKRYKITKPIGLTWYCSVIQVSVFDVWYYLLYRYDFELFMKTESHLADYVRRRYAKRKDQPLTKENIPYAREMRALERARRLREGNPVPPLPVKSLSLWRGNK